MNSFTEKFQEKPILIIYLEDVLPEYQAEFWAAYGIRMEIYDKTARTFLAIKDMCPQLWHEIERIIIKKEIESNDIIPAKV